MNKNIQYDALYYYKSQYGHCLMKKAPEFDYIYNETNFVFIAAEAYKDKLFIGIVQGIPDKWMNKVKEINSLDLQTRKELIKIII